MSIRHDAFGIGALLALLAAAALVLATGASAHEAPTGWKYPWSCCSGMDCRMVKDVKERPEGYVVRSGEVIAYADKRIKDSPDGEFHWCSQMGKDDTPTICLFVPPKGF